MLELYRVSVFAYAAGFRYAVSISSCFICSYLCVSLASYLTVSAAADSRLTWEHRPSNLILHGNVSMSTQNKRGWCRTADLGNPVMFQGHVVR